MAGPGLSAPSQLLQVAYLGSNTYGSSSERGVTAQSSLFGETLFLLPAASAGSPIDAFNSWCSGSRACLGL